MIPDPILVKSTKYDASLSGDSSVTRIFFFEELNIVADYVEYESGHSYTRLHGGTEENRSKVKAYLVEYFPNGVKL